MVQGSEDAIYMRCNLIPNVVVDIYLNINP